MKIKKILGTMLVSALFFGSVGAFAQTPAEENGLFHQKFDFGAEEVGENYTPITVKDRFTEEKGYGLLNAEELLEQSSKEEADAVKKDYLTTKNIEHGIQFAINVPDGDYIVMVLTGSGSEETAANIYINGGERVRAYTLEQGTYQENEQPVVPKDGKIVVQVIGEKPKVNAIEVTQLPDRAQAAEKPTIYIAGDSTAQTYNPVTTYPQTGWGQVASDYFTDDVQIENRSMGGRSLKSYNNDGRLDKILTEMCPGDYVVIQFGHNDGSTKPERFISVDDFKVLLEQKYIGEILKRGGYPLVLTPTPHFSPDEQGNFAPTILDYSAAALEVAQKCAAQGVVGIDAQKAIADRWTELGTEKVKTFYFINEPGESVAYPDGTDDHTHFKEAGAREVAQVIAAEIGKAVPAMADVVYTAEHKRVFDDMKGHWAEKLVTDLAATTIVKGISNTEFAPEKNVTRAEFLSMAMRAASLHGMAYREGECLDASAEDWFRFDLQGALDLGILPEEMIDGYQTKQVTVEATETKPAFEKTVIEGKFYGDQAVTREEMAAIAVNAMQKEPTALKQAVIDYIDYNKVSEWAKPYMENALKLGLVQGMNDGTLAPKANLTRAEAAAVISRMMGLSEL